MSINLDFNHKMQTLNNSFKEETAKEFYVNFDLILLPLQ